MPTPASYEVTGGEAKPIEHELIQNVELQRPKLSNMELIGARG